MDKIIKNDERKKTNKKEFFFYIIQKIFILCFINFFPNKIFIIFILDNNII